MLVQQFNKEQQKKESLLSNESRFPSHDQDIHHMTLEIEEFSLSLNDKPNAFETKHKEMNKKEFLAKLAANPPIEN